MTTAVTATLTSDAAPPPNRRLPLADLADRIRPYRGPLAWALGLLVLWPVLARLLAKGLPPGIVVIGVIYGSLYALAAIGIVLVFRGNRIINFAQAQLGVLAAIVAVELVVHYGLPYLVAMAAGIALAIVIGMVASLLPRHFRKSSRLILTVATIALAQAIAGVSALVPTLFCNPARNASCLTAGNNQTFNTPLHVHLSIYPVIFTGDDIVAVGGAVVLIAGLALFLRASKYGVAIRAAADNGDRARLLGIPVPRLDTIVWSVAALLSAMAVLLQIPVVGFSGFQTVTGGGNDLLLRALAAAVIGRMDSLPRAAAAAVVIESLATWTYSNTTFVDATLVLVIVVALLFQKGAYQRGSESDNSTWRSVVAVRPIPRELAGLAEVRWSLRAAKLAFVIVAVTLPALLTSSQTYLAALVLVYAMVGLSLLVLTGWTGQISLGQFALAGFGGATTAVLYQRHGWAFLAATAAGIVVGAVAALIIGLPALRIQGPFLAVTTLAFGVSASTYFLAPNHLTWFVTPQMTRPTFFGHNILGKDWQLYYLSLLAFFLVLLAVRSLRRSRIGRALIATRDNEAAAKAAGLNTTRMKLTAFLVSGAIAGFAGVIFVIHQQGVNNGSFSADIDISLFLMVVIGGLGSIPGVVVGAIYIWSTQYFLHGNWALVASGAGILVLLIILPEGLGGLLYQLRDVLLRRVAVRRGISVPGFFTHTAEASGPDPGAVAIVEELSPVLASSGSAASPDGPR
jgi:branched-chain amino acid transport system permease protein